MRNIFPGICYRCGKVCKRNEGHFERASKSQAKKWNRYRMEQIWLLQHAECAITYRGTAQHYIFNNLKDQTDAKEKETGTNGRAAT